MSLDLHARRLPDETAISRRTFRVIIDIRTPQALNVVMLTRLVVRGEFPLNTYEHEHGPKDRAWTLGSTPFRWRATRWRENRVRERARRENSTTYSRTALRPVNASVLRLSFRPPPVTRAAELQRLPWYAQAQANYTRFAAISSQGLSPTGT